MKKFVLAALTTAVAGYAGVAGATGVTGNVTFASEYLFRGISQTQQEPALQGSINFNHDSGFYAGAWGSNVDFNDQAANGDSANLEVDLYTGWGGKFSGVPQLGWDINLTYFAYPGQPSKSNYDFIEITPALSYDFGMFNINGKFSYSPDFFGTSTAIAGSKDVTKGAYYTQANIGIPLAYKFTLSGHVGYQVVDVKVATPVDDYVDYSTTLGVNVEGIDLALTISDTNLSQADCTAFAGAKEVCEARAVVSVGRTL